MSGPEAGQQAESWTPGLATRVYELSFVVPLLTWLGIEIHRVPKEFLNPMLLVWAAAIAIVDLLPIPTTVDMTFSLSFPLELAVAMIYANPAVAGLIAFLGSSDLRELRGELSITKALFIRAQIAVSVIAESAMFHSVASLESPWYELGAAVAVAAVVGYSINVLLVAWYVHLQRRKSLLQILREMHIGLFGEFLAAYMGLALFSVLVATSFVKIGIWSIGVFVAPLAFARQMFQRTHSLQVATNELAKRETQLSDIIAHTSDGIFLVSKDGSIISWNPAMEHITGFSSEESVGQIWNELLQTREADHNGLGRKEGSAKELDESPDILVLTKDGTERWIRYSRNSIPDRDERVKAEVLVARDVTSQLQTERLKQEFVAMVSHELRTPLTPIKGFLTSLMNGMVDDAPESREEYYRIMLRQAGRLDRLITDLLDVSSIDSGQLAMYERLIDVVVVVAEQVRDAANQQPIGRVRLTHPEMPVWVRADPFRVGQVVANLLSNALKYSPQDAPVEVAVAVSERQAIVSVGDEGEGIPLSEQRRVFERFYRVANGLTRDANGTGLGLYIAKQLAEAMDGHLWLDSKPGRGCTFSFDLPLAEEPDSVGGPPRLSQDTCGGSSSWRHGEAAAGAPG